MLLQNFPLFVIPAFNRPTQLQAAVNSVLAQTYRNFSLVVVDDASTEDLESVRQSVLESGHQWVRLEQNSGPGEARNKGVQGRDFDWVMFLDSDDSWYPEKVERQMQWIEKNPDYRICQVRERWFRNGKRFSKPKHLEQPQGRVFHDSVRRCAIGPSCVAIRHDLWVESGGFDPWFRVCEDYELWLRIAWREKVGLVPGPPLAEKFGGHADQLSICIPAFDRFRVVALAEFLNRHPDLTGDDRKIVVKTLEQKCRILANGAAKRGRTEWQAFFNDLNIPLSKPDLEQARNYCLEVEPGA